MTQGHAVSRSAILDWTPHQECPGSAKGVVQKGRQLKRARNSVLGQVPISGLIGVGPNGLSAASGDGHCVAELRLPEIEWLLNSILVAHRRCLKCDDLPFSVTSQKYTHDSVYATQVSIAIVTLYSGYSCQHSAIIMNLYIDVRVHNGLVPQRSGLIVRCD
jgi:hypothetical protein